MIQINPYRQQEMYAGGSKAGAMFGSGHQPSVGAAGSVNGSVGGINTGINSRESGSLVDRLNKIDAGMIRPNDGAARSIDGYENDLSVNSVPGVSGENIFISKPTEVAAGNNSASIFNTLNKMDYELHPDSRDEFRGNALYLEG